MRDTSGVRTAIIHYWLLNMRGGERVLEALCRLLPHADLFTMFYDPEHVSPTIRAHRVQTSFLQPFRRHYRALLPLMPIALENLDLRDYDLVISSESGPAKGVLVSSRAKHLCYCHTPMRYLWELYPAYRKEWVTSRWKRELMAPIAHYLRMWDYASAARVDTFIANSENVRRRIWKTYRRHSRVVYPPVAVDSFYWNPPEDYYLAVAELVAYKKLDVAVRVFSRSGRRLKIAGDGPEFRRLKREAAPNIEFCGRVSDSELRSLYAKCRALILPGEEDFGITVIEALASGKPVIAAARGGALETVPVSNPCGGLLYRDTGADSLRAAIEEGDRIESQIRPRQLQNYATQFSEEEFARKMRTLLFHRATKPLKLVKSL